MAPVYESDLADKRFTEEHWRYYELWEKLEPKMRNRRRLIILGACLVYLCLSSIPVVLERYPKWRSLAAVRRLAEEVNQVKQDAIQAHAAYRIRFDGKGRLGYRIERSDNCSAGTGTIVRTGSLMEGASAERYALLDSATGAAFGLKGFAESFCYDYLSGSDVSLRGDPLAGFGVLPVKDVAEHRMDRLALLLLTGPSAEVSFE